MGWKLFFIFINLENIEKNFINSQPGNKVRNEVWIYNPQNGFARKPGPSLKSGRFSHSCSIMKDGDKTFIIIAGGMNKSAGPEYTNSVEIYDPSDNKWHSGKCK